MPENQKKKVLVAGATGYLGGLVVENCKRKGYWVRALARDANRLKVKDLCDEVFVGQATQYETLRGLCDGIDYIFSSVGFMTFDKKPSIWEVDYEANINIVRKAREANIKHFVYTSTINCSEMAKSVKIAEAKLAVTKAIEQSNFSWTIMEPTGFFDDMRKLYDMINKRGKAMNFGKGDKKLNPIHGIDLAEASVRAFEEPSMKNKRFPIGGPDTYTHNEIAELVFDVIGKPPKITHIPLWVLKSISAVARPFNANLADMIWFFISMGVMDMVGPPFGEHRLRDFFVSIHSRKKEE